MASRSGWCVPGLRLRLGDEVGGRAGVDQRSPTSTPYWVPRGWSQQAPIKTESRIDKPRPGDISAGPTVIAGVAWAQHRGIAKVEVQVDDGPWQTATLAAVASVDTLAAVGRCRWDAKSG